MRRYRRGGYGRARSFVKGVIRTAGVKRVLRTQTSITATGSAETKTSLFTVGDSPGSLTVAEAGSKLTMLKIDVNQGQTGTAGDRYEYLVYVNRSALELPSSTPIADFWATTEPPTQNQLLIRRASIKYGKYVVPASQVSSGTFFMKKLFKKGLNLYDGDEVVLVIKNSNASSRAFYVNAIAVTRE